MNAGQDSQQVDQEIEQLAEALWRNLQSLNRATANAEGLDQPTTVQSVVGSLIKLADELHQTVQNLGERLIDEFRSGPLSSDRREDVLRAQDALAESGDRLLKMEQSLVRVQENLSALYGINLRVDGRGGTLMANEAKADSVESAPQGKYQTEFPGEIGQLLAQPPPSAGRSPTPNQAPSQQSRPSL
ncbi:hypothetical protein ACFQ07_33375 [Actinomadura adrarensis]|uniref:Uncharacterized protein n=1 Tax=Actinomadura adrarensis TaxID=1819600 RepID=A0ABW3CTA5_9ACTN